MTGSSLSVTGNTTAALAMGNASTNSLTLNGASMAASGALLNVQNSYGAVTATLIDPTTAIVTGGGLDPSNSTLELSGNVERAIATGNFATKRSARLGQTLLVARTAGPASAFSYTPSLALPIAPDSACGRSNHRRIYRHQRPGDNRAGHRRRHIQHSKPPPRTRRRAAWRSSSATG